MTTVPARSPVMTTVLNRIQGGCFVLATTLLNGPALAHPGSIPLGDEAALTGGAVVALAGDAAAAWYNPAGLSELRGSSVQTGASFYGLRIRKVPGGYRVGDGKRKRTVDLVDAAIRAVPSSVIFTHRTRRGLTLAVGVYTLDQDNLSFSAQVEDLVLYRRGDARAFRVRSGADLDDRRATYAVGPSLGFRIGRNLSLGLGLWAVQRSHERDFQVWSRAEADPTGPSSTRSFSQVRGRLNESSWGGRLGVGLQWRAPEGWKVGLMMRTPELSVLYWPESQVIEYQSQPGPGGENVDQFSVPIDRSALRRRVGSTGAFEVELGLGHVGERWGFAAQAELRSPNRRDPNHQYISGHVAGGAMVQVSEKVRLGAGVYYDIEGASLRGYHANLNHLGVRAGLSLRRRFGRRVRRRPFAGRAASGGGDRRGIEVATTASISYAVGLGQVATANLRWGSTASEIPIPDRVVSGSEQILVPLAAGRVRGQFHDLGLHLGSVMRF